MEVVSNRIGREFDEKLKLYARIGVLYYIIYDSAQFYGGDQLYLFQLSEGRYERSTSLALPLLGLTLRLHQSVYEGMDALWLRWADNSGNLLPTAEERISEEAQRASAEQQRADAERQRADAERQRADAERQRADAERQRADAERQRAEQLAQKLRELGVNPDE